LRVLAVVHQFPPEFQTGTEILCLRTMQIMSQRGHAVRVVAADPRRGWSSPCRDEMVDGVHTIFVPTWKRVGKNTAARLRFYSPGDNIDVLVEQAAAFRPDIIHIHHVSQFGLKAVTHLSRVAPVVITATDFHLICPYATALLGDGSACSGPREDGVNCLEHLMLRPLHHGMFARGAVARVSRWLRRKFEFPRSPVNLAAFASARSHRKEAFASASLVIAGSERMRAMFVAAGARPDNITILPHEAPPLHVPDTPLGTPLRIGFHGTLSAHKGAHILLKAIATLPPELRFVAIIQGDAKPDANYVASLRAIAAGDQRIQFKAAVPNDQYGASLAELDIVVIPSLWAENRPITMLSAIEAGRYVVGSNVPGIAEILGESDGGCLVPPGDPQALGLCLAGLLADPSTIERIRTRPVRRSRFADYVDNLERHYADARSRSVRLQPDPRG
jgi:glycosyltransferase involved in cell wall biosynthesis